MAFDRRLARLAAPISSGVRLGAEYAPQRGAFGSYYLLYRRPANHGGSVVICSYSMLKVEGSNPRDCALRPLTTGVVSVWIYLFAVGSGRL